MAVVIIQVVNLGILIRTSSYNIYKTFDCYWIEKLVNRCSVRAIFVVATS